MHFFAILLLFTKVSVGEFNCNSLFSKSQNRRVHVSELVLNHIILGEFSENKLKSGLHTVEGLSALQKKQPGLIDLVFVEPQFVDIEPVQWFHVSVAENGVLWAKLPSAAFTRQGRKNLRAAHQAYTGGYLWKTLFPVHLNRTDIQKAIENVVAQPKKIEPMNDQKSYYFGDYSFLNKGKLLSIDVVVLVNEATNEVLTAYPNFNQSSERGGYVTKSSNLLFQKNQIRDTIKGRYKDRQTSQTFFRWASEWRLMGSDGKIDSSQIQRWPAFKKRIFYGQLFNAEFFRHSLDGLATVTLINGGLKQTYNSDIHLLFYQSIKAMVRDPQLSPEERLSYLHKSLYILTRTSRDTEHFIFDIVILNEILIYVAKNYSVAELKNFHQLFINSPIHWFLNFPVSSIQSILHGPHRQLTALAVSALEYAYVPFIGGKPSSLITAPPATYANELASLAKYLAEDGFSLYLSRVAKNRLNTERASLDLIQDRINYLIFLRCAFERGIRSSANNIHLRKLFVELSKSIESELPIQRKLLQDEFGFLSELNFAYSIEDEKHFIPQVYLQIVNNRLEVTIKNVEYTITRN
jgi:hypothetical protein